MKHGKRKLVLVLDVDETLIHSSTDPSFKGDFTVNGYHIRKRPYLDEFIRYITDNPYYDPGIWSAAVDEYVKGIVDRIFPDPSILRFIETREFCNERRDKPLSRIRKLYNERYGTDLSRSDFIIVDDRDNVTKYDELNHIRIDAYMGEENDRELLSLIEFLKGNVGLPSECLVINWQ